MELLVAYDDISNCRYVVEDFDLVPIYVESKLPQKHLTREKLTPLPSVPGFSGEGILPDDSLVEVTVISQDSEVYVPGSPPEPSEMRSQYKPSGTRDVSQVTSSSNTEATQRLSSARTAKPRRPSASGYVSNLVGRFESEDPMTVASVRRSATKHSTTTPRPPAGDDSPRPLNRDHSEFAADVSNTLCNPPNKEDKILLNNHSESSTILSPVSHPRHLGDARPLSGSACSPGSRRITSQAKISCPSPLVESPTATSRVPSSVLSKKYTQHSSKTILSDPDTSSAYQSESLPHRMKQKSSSHKVNKDGTLGAVMVDSLPRHSSRPSSHRSTRSPVKSSMNHPKPGEVRRVRLRRDHPGEEVGITIALRTPSPPEVERSSNDSPVLAIQRVMVGSLADRCGTLFPGDILLEFNGCPVRSKDQVLELMRQASGALEFDILVKAPFSVDTFLKPGLQHKQDTVHSKRYIRTFFDYNAQKDALMPTGDVGLSFKAGEVLELIDDQDPNWWQVRPLNDSRGKARLIPSQTLEERRKAFNEEKTPNSSLLKARRKIKKFFRASDASALRLRADLWSYEEVVPWPQSTIPCLLLLGVTGVGRRNLKVLLVNAEPKRFAYPMSDTTDPAASTNQFCILSKSQMEADVRSGAYVEWGKIDGHFYGIRFAAIRKIIASGRTAVLDCEPQTVHLLHQPEYNPCAVFVAPPTFEVAKRMMEEGVHAGVTKNTRSDAELNAMIDASKRYASQYRHLYFHTLINSDMRHSVDKLRRLVSRLEQQPSWIPSGWAYELSVPALADYSSQKVRQSLSDRVLSERRLNNVCAGVEQFEFARYPWSSSFSTINDNPLDFIWHFRGLL
ncbi:unnamed protein product [Dicrocoelium dendriticum]|nr:unnamed protein product [Dicrocoelium dendriticum]